LAVSWYQSARADLGTIFAHIAADNRGAAERWIGRILEHADLAAEVMVVKPILMSKRRWGDVDAGKVAAGRTR
jgi:hypothetical protein